MNTYGHAWDFIIKLTSSMDCIRRWTFRLNGVLTDRVCTALSAMQVQTCMTSYFAYTTLLVVTLNCWFCINAVEPNDVSEWEMFTLHCLLGSPPICQWLRLHWQRITNTRTSKTCAKHANADSNIAWRTYNIMSKCPRNLQFNFK